MEPEHIIPDNKRFGLSFRLALLAGASFLPMVHAAHAVSCPPGISSAVTGPVLLTGNCTIASTGAISGGAIGLLNDGNIAALTNLGGITAGDLGIYNLSGSIGALINAGTISAVSGIVNQGGGTISTLTNSGAINGASGIVNYNTIGQLTNSGAVTATKIGVQNTGGIGAITNTGSISGATDIANSGTIGNLSNSGAIQGQKFGITNGSAASAGQGGHPILSSVASAASPQPQGSINTLANSGNISGDTGIRNAGTIVQLTNSGVIAGIAAGISNSGGIGAIDNTGLIEGAEGFFTSGTGATLINSGTIMSTDGGNAIDFGTRGGNFLTLTTGSDIIGTIYGGGSENQIALDGTGTMNNSIGDFAPGSLLDIAAGANWTASGNWQVPTVTNDGVFQPGILGTPLNLNGNFVQNPDGTLRILVSPAGSPFATTHFNITGTAQLAGGVKFSFAPGTYSAGSIAFLSAAGGVTGGFASATYHDPEGVNGLTTFTTGNTAGLRLSGVVAPLDDSIFSDELQSSAAAAQSANASLLDKASAGDAGAACATQAVAQAAIPGQSGISAMTNAVASAICGAGGWIVASGTAMRAYGESDVPSYSANTAGFLAGIDKPVNSNGLRIGLAVGYDETFLRNGASSKGQVDTTRFGLFGSQTLGRFTLAGDFMAGFSNTTTNRVTGVGLANSTQGGDFFAGGLQIETLLQMNGINLVPQAGIKIAAVNAGASDESGDNVVEPFSLTGVNSSYVSVQPFVNLSLSHQFLTNSGIAITPTASLGYFYEAGARGRAVSLAARDGTVFTSNYVELAGSAGQAALGISASKGMWSLYARYSADVAANWVSQTGEAGLRLRF